MDAWILPECYIDTTLIEILVPPQKLGYNHKKGCNNVALAMQNELKDKFALGIIDKDKKMPKYVAQFDLVYEIGDHLELHKNKSKPHYLIFICPAAEKWLLQSAEDARLSLQDFGLPTELKPLCDITKVATSKHNDPRSDNFKQFFKALKKEKPQGVAVLMFWMTYLKEKTYQANINELITATKEILAKE
jgi:hypothetical protein